MKLPPLFAEIYDIPKGENAIQSHSVPAGGGHPITPTTPTAMPLSATGMYATEHLPVPPPGMVVSNGMMMPIAPHPGLSHC